MADALAFAPRNVPIVGQPVKVLQHYHTYVVQCQCEAQTVSVIIGDGQGAQCPQCQGIPSAQLEGGVVKLGFARPRSVEVVN